MKTLLDVTTEALRILDAVMTKPPVVVFRWDGRERLTQVENDHFTLYAWNPVTLAEGILRLSLGADAIPLAMVEAFVEEVVQRLGFEEPWTIGQVGVRGWATAWRRANG